MSDSETRRDRPCPRCSTALRLVEDGTLSLDYTIVFVNQIFDMLHPSEVIVSYLRWTTDVVPPD